MTRLRVAIFSEEPGFIRETAEWLAAADAEPTVTVTEPAALMDALKAEEPALLLADLGHAPHESLDLLASLDLRGIELLLCGPHDDSRVILRAMQLGAREYLPHAPSREEFEQAVGRLRLQRDTAATATSARILAVMGAKGGVGATCVASQLATALEAAGRRTAVVDLNFPLGDVALHFDVEPSYTLADVAREEDDLDATYLRTILQIHESGVRILAAPPRIEDSELIQGTHVERLLAVLRDMFDFVVIDVSRNWNDASVRALDLADQILVVTSLDVPTLHHARKHMELLRRLGHQADKIHAVVNRFSSHDAVSEKDFTRFLGQPARTRIPNDYASTVESVNQGRPLVEIAPKAPLTEAYRDLARQVHAWCGLETPDKARTKNVGNRLRRLFER